MKHVRSDWHSTVCMRSALMVLTDPSCASGWWQSGWLPNNFSEVEDMLSTEDKRMSVTAAQMEAMEQIVPNVLPTLSPSRRRSFMELGMKFSQIMK